MDAGSHGINNPWLGILQWVLGFGAAANRSKGKSVFNTGHAASRVQSSKWLYLTRRRRRPSLCSTLCKKRCFRLGGLRGCGTQLNMTHLCLRTSGDVKIQINGAWFRLFGTSVWKQLHSSQGAFGGRDWCCFKKKSHPDHWVTNLQNDNCLYILCVTVCVLRVMPLLYVRWEK